MRKAIEALIQYMRLHTDALFPRLEEKDTSVTISRMLVGEGLRTRQVLELSVGVLSRILKTFRGTTLQPGLVSIMHSPPKRPQVLREFLIPRCSSTPISTEFVCKVTDLEKPIPTADPLMARYLKQYFDSILPSPRAEVSETVRELVWVLLKSGKCSAGRVAKHLGVDRRTVNRRLASEGNSYSAIRDAVRRDLARSLVREGHRPLQEAALVLGFSGLSTFSRWFKNRLGQSASEFRANMLT